MSRKPLVQMQNTGYRRGQKWLVRRIDLALNEGEIVTLVGPNGSGKSTTAKLALGVLSPTEGRVDRMDGLRISYVPQKLSIDWTLPLKVGRFMNLTGRLAKGDIEQALAATGAAHLRDAEMHSLSGGEFQRVQLARAMARRPRLMVLDEPLQGVDYTGEIGLYGLIRDIRDKTNCGILLISHDLHVVMAATDRVVCLNGHICCQGPPGSVLESAEYRDLFGMRGGEALALYGHQHDHTHLPDGRVAPACRHDAHAPTPRDTSDG